MMFQSAYVSPKFDSSFFGMLRRVGCHVNTSRRVRIKNFIAERSKRLRNWSFVNVFLFILNWLSTYLVGKRHPLYDLIGLRYVIGLIRLKKVTNFNFYDAQK